MEGQSRSRILGALFSIPFEIEAALKGVKKVLLQQKCFTCRRGLGDKFSSTAPLYFVAGPRSMSPKQRRNLTPSPPSPHSL